ncbi:hypothetical protein V8E36_008213 [Tilletia maclaganii]
MGSVLAHRRHACVEVFPPAPWQGREPDRASRPLLPEPDCPPQLPPCQNSIPAMEDLPRPPRHHANPDATQPVARTAQQSETTTSPGRAGLRSQPTHRAADSSSPSRATQPLRSTLHQHALRCRPLRCSAARLCRMARTRRMRMSWMSAGSTSASPSPSFVVLVLAPSPGKGRISAFHQPSTHTTLGQIMPTSSQQDAKPQQDCPQPHARTSPASHAARPRTADAAVCFILVRFSFTYSLIPCLQVVHNRGNKSKKSSQHDG